MSDIVLTITIPDALTVRATDALCHPQGYDWDGIDPPTKKEFAEQIIADFLRREVKRIEREIRESIRQTNAQTITTNEEDQAAIDDAALDGIG
jgi:hypothetical protein